jgi:hypothetical protein
MKKLIIEQVKEMVGERYLYFDDAISVKKTPHSIPVKMWAVSISPDDVIYLMDSNQEWNPLEETDMNYHLVIASLYQRVVSIYKQFKTVA